MRVFIYLFIFFDEVQMSCKEFSLSFPETELNLHYTLHLMISRNTVLICSFEIMMFAIFAGNPTDRTSKLTTRRGSGWYDGIGTWIASGSTPDGYDTDRSTCCGTISSKYTRHSQHRSSEFTLASSPTGNSTCRQQQVVFRADGN